MQLQADSDGNGSLDLDEFRMMVRRNAGVSSDVVSDVELEVRCAPDSVLYGEFQSLCCSPEV